MKTETKNLILFHIISFSISLLSAYLIWLQTSKYGIGLTPDSIVYLNWSKAISETGLSFVIQNNSATFPPLYPVVLATLAHCFQADHMLIARWFNIVLSFAFSFSSLILYRKLTKNLAALFVFGLFITFSKPINHVFSFAFSEPLFIFLLLLITFSVESTTYKRLILCGFLSALAILTRYAGVAIVPAVCLYVVIQKNNLVIKVKQCFCYAANPTLTYIVYLVRNYYFTKTLMGNRPASNTGLISNCDRVFSTVALWFSGQYFFLIALILLILGAIVWNMKKKWKIYIVNCPKIIIFSFSFSLIYSIFIITSSTTTAFALINVRLMSPIFLPILLMVFSLCSFCHHPKPSNKEDKILFYSFFALFVICSLLSFINTWKQDILPRKNNGAGGYHTVFWEENKVINYLKTQRFNLAEKIYTNDPYPFYLFDKKIDPSAIPWKKHYNSYESTTITLDNFLSKTPDFENSILVYFNDIGQSTDHCFTLNELQTICEMESVLETLDGSVFKVGKCKNKVQ